MHRWLLGGLLFLVACDDGGSSRASTGAGGAGGADAPGRRWERKAIGSPSRDAAIEVSPDGSIALAYVGEVNGEPRLLWQELGGAAELIAEAPPPRPPEIARDASGNVHVVWSSSASGEVRYAVRKGTSWVAEVVADSGYHSPDLAMLDGKPVITLVSDTSPVTANLATRGDAGWTIAPVNKTYNSQDTRAGVAQTQDGRLLVASANAKRNGVWVAESDASGAFTITDLASDLDVEGPVDVAAGDAGTAVVFKNNRNTMVAWRPSGGAWVVELASTNNTDRYSLGVAVGPSGPVVIASAVNGYETNAALLERGPGGWSAQMLGPERCTESSALRLDAAGKPVVALTCERESSRENVYVLSVAGTFPADWSSRCKAAATEFCNAACECASEGKQCGWGSDGNTLRTDPSVCSISAEEMLCGDPAMAPESLDACRAAMASLTCGADGPLDLSTGPCAALYRPF